MNKRFNSQVLLALYTINKSAKQTRDMITRIKTTLKALLFENARESAADSLTESDIQYLNEHGIDLRFPCCELFYGPCWNNRDINDAWNNELYKYEQYEYRSYYEDCIEEAIQDCYPDYEITDNDMETISIAAHNFANALGYHDVKGAISCIADLYEDWPSMTGDLDYLVEPDIEYQGEYEKGMQLCNQMHELLHTIGINLGYVRDNLYALKDITLERTGAEPVAYHALAGSEESILAYYILSDEHKRLFKFHKIVNNPLLLDQAETKIEIDRISSENKLTSDQMTIDDAIDIIFEYCGLPEELKHKVLEEVSIIEELAALTSVRIDRPIWTRYNRPYNEYDYGDDEDYDDDDEFYEDYDDDDYDYEY